MTCSSLTAKILVALFRTPNPISHRNNLTIKIWFPKHPNEVLGFKMQLEPKCTLGMIVGKSTYLISSKDRAGCIKDAWESDKQDLFRRGNGTGKWEVWEAPLHGMEKTWVLGLLLGEGDCIYLLWRMRPRDMKTGYQTSNNHLLCF